MPCSSVFSVATLSVYHATTPSAHTHTRTHSQREEMVDMTSTVLLNEWIVKIELVSNSQRTQKKKKKNQSYCPRVNPARHGESRKRTTLDFA